MAVFVILFGFCVCNLITYKASYREREIRIKIKS